MGWTWEIRDAVKDGDGDGTAGITKLTLQLAEHAVNSARAAAAAHGDVELVGVFLNVGHCGRFVVSVCE